MTTNTSQPNLSSQQLIKLSIIAIISTIIVVIVAVMPAQYGKDYTGLGKKLGFSKLYQDHNEVDKKIAEKEAAMKNK